MYSTFKRWLTCKITTVNIFLTLCLTGVHDDRDSQGLVVGHVDGEGPDAAADAKRGLGSSSSP